jgi:hypothetical protein
LQDQQLENLTMKMDLNGVKGVKLESVVPLPVLTYGAPGATYVCIRRAPDTYPTGIIII